MRVAPLLAAFALAAGLVGFSTVSGQLPPDKAKKADADLVRLQGEWTVTKVELFGGEAPPPNLLKSIKVTVRENRVTAEFTGDFAGKEQPGHALLILDSTRTPRHIDVIPADAKGQPRRMVVRSTAKGGKDKDEGPLPPILGLYRLDGDALTVSIPLGGEGPRPTELKAAPRKNPDAPTREDRGAMLIQLARKK